MVKATLIAALMTAPSRGGEELAALPETVEWLEVRSDLVGELDPDWLRSHFRGRLLYVLRSRTQGGRFEGSPPQRHERLSRAAQAYDLVELEGERDLSTDLLNEIPIEKRLLSWYGKASELAELQARFTHLSAVPATIYKLVTEAVRCADELVPLSLLNSLGRSDTIAYSTGSLGFWSRLVAPRLGAPIIYGMIPNGPAIPTEPTINKLIEDYGLPALMPLERIYGIVGSPVFHSLSPLLHNAAYRALGQPALFVPFHVDSFDDFWQGVVESGQLESLGLSIKGMTIASPHKESAPAMAQTMSEMVKLGGTANLLLRDGDNWRADTTDPDGVILTLRERGLRVSGRRAAVIGCGGAGRAIAAALAQAGAEVVLVNRGATRGHRASQFLNLPFVALSEFSAVGYSLLINATPVGRDGGELPFDVEELSEDAVVIDLVYGAKPTPLAAKALALGRSVIDGREVLLAQVFCQFHRMTGLEMPVNMARKLISRETKPANQALAEQCVGNG
jgi:3-dehydroquinate dehydratase/shikimate dehydrogenase